MSALNPVSFFLSGDQPLPSSAQTPSPLKRQAPPIKKIASDTLRRSLFGEKRQKIDDHHQVSSLMATSALSDKSPPLRMQVEVMEKHMELKSMLVVERSVIRLKINQILNNAKLSEENKLIELGLFYYDLSRGKKIPEGRESSFFATRIVEIESEIRNLEVSKTCTLGEGGKQLPSGNAAYLIRTLVKMIFPSDGGLNLGGCYAVVALLKTHLNSLVTEEMHSQILKIIHRLLHDPDFSQLFQKPFPVHSSMEELICVDLMMPLTEKMKMNFVYVRWSMLSALFSLMGQMEEINCYAVAKMMNLQSEHPDVLVKLMIEVLMQGAFCYDKTRIPIFPLLESRRSYEPDFTMKMTASEARDLPSYAITRFALQSVTPFTMVPETQKQSLGDWMKLDFNENVGLAKQFFLSLKLSFLQQTILAILQFGSLNATQKILGYRSFKMRVMRGVMGLIRRRIDKRLENQKTDIGLQDFMDNFLYSLQSAFFCIDYTNWDHTIKDGRVIFDYHSQGFIFNGDLEDYESCRSVRRLFYASPDSFMPVDSLTGFIKICLELLEEVGAEIKCPYIIDFQHILCTHLKSAQFLQDLAKHMEYINQEESELEWEDYAEADSLFLIQDGGSCRNNGDLKTLGGKFSEIYKVSSHTLDFLFIELCNHFRVLAENEGSCRFGSFVMASTKGHAFNLMPFRFQRYWKDPITEMQEKLIRPGVLLLCKPLSFMQMSRILRYAFRPLTAERITRSIVTHEMRVPEFQAKVYGCIDRTLHDEFDTALKRVIEEIGYTPLVSELLNILRAQDVDLNFHEFQEVTRKMAMKKEDYFNAYEAAQLVQTALANCSRSICIPIKQLEDTICQRFDLPQIVEIANLTWMEYVSDRSIFTYLVMFYDIAEHKITFGEREQGQVKPLSPEETKEFSICEYYLNSRGT